MALGLRMETLRYRLLAAQVMNSPGLSGREIAGVAVSASDPLRTWGELCSRMLHE